MAFHSPAPYQFQCRTLQPSLLAEPKIPKTENYCCAYEKSPALCSSSLLPSSPQMLIQFQRQPAWCLQNQREMLNRADTWFSALRQRPSWQLPHPLRLLISTRLHPSKSACGTWKNQSKKDTCWYCPKLQPAHTNSHLPLLYLGCFPPLPLPFTGCHTEAWVPPVKHNQQGMLLTPPTVQHLKDNCYFSPLVMTHLAQVTSTANILLYTFKIRRPKPVS